MEITAAGNPIITPAVDSRRLGDLREASHQLVADAFIQTLLDAAQDSSLKGSYGHGGRGEEVFAEQMNIVLAERVAASPRLDVADALYERLAQRYLGTELQHKNPEVAG